MNHSTEHHHEMLQHRYGMYLAARLNDASNRLPHEINERLRAAREQAVARRKRRTAVPASALTTAGSATLTFGPDEEGLGWLTRLASVLPLVALVAGLLALQAGIDEITADEIAEVDSALLTDDLPPAAYTDPGFAQYLKVSAIRP